LERKCYLILLARRLGEYQIDVDPAGNTTTVVVRSG
jgi:hypothetical protein